MNKIKQFIYDYPDTLITFLMSNIILWIIIGAIIFGIPIYLKRSYNEDTEYILYIVHYISTVIVSSIITLIHYFCIRRRDIIATEPSGTRDRIMNLIVILVVIIILLQTPLYKISEYVV